MGQRTVITRQEVLDPDREARAEEREEQELNPNVILFDLGVVEEKKISKIAVLRTDPHEGYLGALDPDASESTIKARWGGGTFRLEAKNDAGRVCKVKSITIAGDPVFESELAERRWKRLQGVRDTSSTATHEEAEEPRLSFKEMMLLQEQREEKRQREGEEREERRRREDAEREERRRTAEREAHERQVQLMREDAERRERMAREEAERREKEHERQVQRDRDAQAALIAQNQQFFTNMLAMVKEGAQAKDSSSPLEVMKSTVEMMSMLRDGAEPKDAVTALIERLPETLAEARETAKQAVREIKGEPDTSDGRSKRAETNDQLVIKGRTATQVKALIRHLVAQGKDPKAFIENLSRAVITRQAPATAKGSSPSKSSTRRPSRRAPPKSAQRSPPKTPSGKPSRPRLVRGGRAA